MSELNFNDVEIKGNNLKYITPGVHPVKVKEVKSGVSSTKGSPFVEIKVEDANGAVCSNQYYLNTTKGPSGKSAWDISKNAIFNLVVSATNLDVKTVKEKFSNITGAEDLANKISTLTKDKGFRMKFIGKAVIPTDSTKNPFIKTEFGRGNYVFESLNTNPSMLKFDTSKDVETLPTKVTETVSKTDDLPW